MASFLKKLTKEIGTIKAMVDIPALKNERTRLEKNRDDIDMCIRASETIVSQLPSIEHTIACLTDLKSTNIIVDDNDEMGEKVNALIEYLTEKMKNAMHDIETAAAQKQAIVDAIEKINAQLKAARGKV